MNKKEVHKWLISIHAPTKGATSLSLSGLFCFSISIHAPTKGATQGAGLREPPFLFQSTLPRRERPENKDMEAPNIKISIHAPTKGATIYFLLFRIKTAHFNPRSHEGSDPLFLYSCRNIFRFQSTLPRRERLTTESVDSQHSTISIHAPTKGATKFIIYIVYEFLISIHAPTKGATLLPVIRRFMLPISIHAPTKGATAILYNKFLLFHIILTNPSKDT